MFEDELREALRAGRPEPPESYRTRLDIEIARLRLQEGITMKRSTRALITAAVFLALTMAAAAAAGIITWRRGLDDKLKLNEETLDIFKDTDLIDLPGLSQTHNGVTVTLEECVVQPDTAYIAFRVSGYRPELRDEGPYSHEEPQFRETLVTVDGVETVDYLEPRFFNGLDGWGILADGSSYQEGSNFQYLNENGEMVYIITLYNYHGNASFVGRQAHVTLKDLGVDSTRYTGTEVHAEGTWDFAWTLKGSGRGVELKDLDLVIGTTGAKLKELTLRPVSARMTVTVPPEAPEGRDEFGNTPVFRGVRLKDGTVYGGLAGRGFIGLDDEDTCGQMWTLLRIIDPEQVESLLFTRSMESEEVIQVRITP
ncbi:MAG: DUF4179 domain-containing protein [Clostridia bacterium]|nr:DUF4179 domain-containing protein [Clostridia bacterium]